MYLPTGDAHLFSTAQCNDLIGFRTATCTEGTASDDKIFCRPFSYLVVLLVVKEFGFMKYSLFRFNVKITLLVQFISKHVNGALETESWSYNHKA